MECTCGGELTLAPPRHPPPEVIKQLLGRPRYSRRSRLRKKFAKRHAEEVRVKAYLMASLSFARGPSWVCTKCQRPMGFYRAVAHNLFPIQPLPPGARPIYDRDPGVAELVAEPKEMTEQEKQALVQSYLEHGEEGRKLLGGG